MSSKISDALRSRVRPAAAETVELNVFLHRPDPAETMARAATADRAMASVAREVLAEIQEPVLPILREHGAERIQSLWINNLVCARLPVAELPAALQKLKDSGAVDFLDEARYSPLTELMDAEPATPLAPPTPPLDAFRATWNVDLLEAPILWDQGITGEGIRVAVIDSGVNYLHPDLEHRMWTPDGLQLPGLNFGALPFNFDATAPVNVASLSADALDPMDRGGDGHGTACAGLIAGDGTSGEITGVAPGASLLALRVGDEEGLVSDWSIWKAFQFAVEIGVDVLSMSLSWKRAQNPNHPGWRRVCEMLLGKGILHANSIGNLGGRGEEDGPPYNIGVPGNCPPPYLHPRLPIRRGTSSAISCGATSQGDVLSPESGRGPVVWNQPPLFNDYPLLSNGRQGLMKPDLCAPGVGVKSCNSRFPAAAAQPYRPFGGTSAATAQIAGCLALLVQGCRRRGVPVVPAALQQSLEHTAKRLLGQTEDKENGFGAGRVRVEQAYHYILGRNGGPVPGPVRLPLADSVSAREKADNRLTRDADDRLTRRGKVSDQVATLLATSPPETTVRLTVITGKGQEAEDVAELLRQDPSTQWVDADAGSGIVFFIGPLRAVSTLVARPEVVWIDLENQIRLQELFDR